MSRVLSKIVQGAEEIFLFQVCHLSYMEAQVILQYFGQVYHVHFGPMSFLQGFVNKFLYIDDQILSSWFGVYWVNIFRLSHVGNLWKDQHILVGTGVHWSIGIVMTCLSLVRLEPGVKLHCFIM